MVVRVFAIAETTRLNSKVANTSSSGFRTNVTVVPNVGRTGALPDGANTV
jgi:hypothetical protein